MDYLITNTRNIFSRFYLLAVLVFFLPGLSIYAGDIVDRFVMTSDRNIMRSEHLGIINHHVTCGVPYENVGTLNGFWAPPFVSSDSRADLSVDGKSIPVNRWTWWPMRFVSEGIQDSLMVKSDCLLVSNQRAATMRFTLTNKTNLERKVKVKLQLSIPTLDKSDRWDFPIERSHTSCKIGVESNSLGFTQGELALVFSGKDWVWNTDERTGTATVIVPASGSRELVYAVAIGPRQYALNQANSLVDHFNEETTTSLSNYERDLAGIYERLPRLESDNQSLVHLYDRSLMHFFTNCWKVDEFVLNPYYGTGSMLGGCVCCYLWNYGEPWEIMQLYDPVASKAHFRQFLKINLTRHYAFLPTSGKGTGPWYMINQEKILGHLYYYLKLTGKKDFLQEEVNGRPLYEHVLEQATAKDDLTRPVALVDYGDSNSHLELRRAPNLYNHVMPDLNGRRYANYIMGAVLLEAAGHPDNRLYQRAADLKKILKDKLWNPKTKWFDFINDQGKPETRWTIQMYKLIHSPVLDEEEYSGMLDHWNERKFLGPYGVHSLALDDPWFDPADVDNGGPGACTDFGPQIAERFYKAGRPDLGADILRRMLWLGERMPYWGDSVVASQMEYRHDTPLQCMFDSVTMAQTIIFGMFGITSRFDGIVEITPYRPDFAEKVALYNIRLRGLCFDVLMNPDYFEVRCGRKIYRASYGQKMELTADSARLSFLPD